MAEVDRSYVAGNNAERERLQQLIERLSDEELSRPISAGWTISGILAHLAFWDGHAICLMDKWESGIAPSIVDREPEEIDWINDSAKPMFLALPPRTAAQLALQQAEEADRRVAVLSDELVMQMLEIGGTFNLSRASHRQEHLDEIETYLVG